MVKRGTEFAYDVFISYSHRDAEWVWNWLVPRLKRGGGRGSINQKIKNVVSKFLYEQTKRRPMILLVVMEV